MIDAHFVAFFCSSFGHPVCSLLPFTTPARLSNKLFRMFIVVVLLLNVLLVVLESEKDVQGKSSGRVS